MVTGWAGTVCNSCAAMTHQCCRCHDDYDYQTHQQVEQDGQRSGDGPGYEAQSWMELAQPDEPQDEEEQHYALQHTVDNLQAGCRHKARSLCRPCTTASKHVAAST